ncbi:MAG: hypothetical protein IJ651_09720 [Bacteroidales bacterium]|nr:hypothetical protein [Bacteroidales bacterium]
MKPLDEITRLSADDLERIGADESIPVPEDLEVRLPAPDRPASVWPIAAAAALLIGVGVSGYLGVRQPRDTFSDPYEAYAAVEKALGKMSGTISKGADYLTEAQFAIDKLNYWK